MSYSDFIILSISSACFGTIMGAYFCTVQHRIFSHEPLITSFCFCPNCKNKLSLFLQIPIISWIFLRGQCYYCKQNIPKKYPLTEGFFLLFYFISFILLYSIPLLLIGTWIIFIFFLLLIYFHSLKYISSVIKALSIFLIYHMIYGSVLIVILSAIK